MKRSNVPLIAVTGILVALFVIPFILAVIFTLAYGEFALPPAEFVTAVLAELDANFVLAMLITALPLALVAAIEGYRRQRGGGRRSLALTVGLLVLLMAAVTAVPLIAFLRPLSGLPGGAVLAILLFAALPLLAVMFAAAIVLPGLRGDG